jgi:hypothetical protein
VVVAGELAGAGFRRGFALEAIDDDTEALEIYAPIIPREELAVDRFQFLEG